MVARIENNGNSLKVTESSGVVFYIEKQSIRSLNPESEGLKVQYDKGFFIANVNDLIVPFVSTIAELSEIIQSYLDIPFEVYTQSSLLFQAGSGKISSDSELSTVSSLISQTELLEKILFYIKSIAE